MGFFKNLFTWWDGATLGTALFSWKNGRKVGEDQLGNRYFETKKREGRRWVMYAGSNDVSRVPPEWYAWLTRQIDGVPDEALPPPPKFLRAADAEPHRHARGLSPDRRARERRPAAGGERRLSGLDARLIAMRGLVPSLGTGALLALAACSPRGADEQNRAERGRDSRTRRSMSRRR